MKACTGSGDPARGDADRAAAREIFDDIASRISEPELRATFEATFAEIEEGVG